MDMLAIVDLLPVYHLFESRMKSFNWEMTHVQVNHFAQYVVSIFEQKLTGIVTQGLPEEEFLKLVRIPKWIWDELCTDVTDHITHLFWTQKALSNFESFQGVAFDFKFHGFGLLMIRCFSPVTEKPKGLGDMTLKEIKKAIASGDFFPTDVRKIVEKYT